ncbi:class D beta-lactamase [Ancylobacter sp. WKF20]|uniref:class D beta-lactamase n=1 Tax=Ancylobacter sp. WKF20 TaxID=3039801 RepID=UPI0024342295|nr:class D beta-lactamase [Ancylobacter sp. WKF20]WGD31816.1 class D beta-lactamase [Ancylobacter sp. WKF20]
MTRHASPSRPRLFATALAALALAGLAAPASAATLCTLIAEASTGKVLSEEGPGCAGRVTPASTFKIPIALMGYDAGIITDAHAPVWSFKPGFPDWREEWKRDTDPTYWMKESVVWYSQEITGKLGMERFRRYVTGFGYGNEDVSGTKDKGDGLTRSWLSTSLAISPREQAAFLGRMLRGDLPVSPQAVAMTAAIIRHGEVGGWTVHGKTGMGFALDATGAPVRGQPYGWYVGWASKQSRTLIFARLDRDATRQATPTSIRARDSLLSELPTKLDALAGK